MKKYRVDWEMISESYQQQRDFLEYDGEIFPVDERGDRMEILTVQGGVFSPRGHLFYMVNGYSSSGDGHQVCRGLFHRRQGFGACATVRPVAAPYDLNEEFGAGGAA